MSEVLLPLIEDEWKKPPASTQDTPLITSLGLIEGEVLTYLEQHGATKLRGLIRELEWPARMVMMAVGALIREGLVRGVQHELEIIVEPLRPQPKFPCEPDKRVAEVWGG
jgi:hypothetical protein